MGATKSGTSWLYEMLAAHPQCHLRSIKELHFFDALDQGRVEREIRAHSAACEALRARLETAPAARLPDILRKLADRDEWREVLRRGGVGGYLEYLLRDAGQARLVADVTPAYALLGRSRLRDMARLTPDTRVLYLMRDPLERLWSHVRMIARRRADPESPTQDRALRICERVLRGGEGHIARRGDYRGALTRLRAAVPPDRLLTLFYEDMFGGEGLDRLCGFLGLDRPRGDLPARVHAGEWLDMPAALRDKARDWLAPQYDFVARLGPLPQAWQANMVRV